jgi:predicted Zn-dependent protease
MSIRSRVQDEYLPVQLWHDNTVQAMKDSRAEVLPRLLLPVRKAGLTAAGFVGMMAQSEAYFARDGISAFADMTDSEVTLTIRGDQGQAGWHGQAARDWSKIDLDHVVEHALRIAERSARPVAVEPGRRTAILSAEAMGQIAQAMSPFFNLNPAEAFKQRSKIRWGGRYFDPRITISSDPRDPDGGYKSYFRSGIRTTPITYITRGILTDLSAGDGLGDGKPPSVGADSMRISGGPTSVEQMIAQCKEGIYVNRLYGMDVVDGPSGMMTGTTSDGCFLVKNGKIDRPVKNFRIQDSPMFFLNKLEAIGPTARVALGYMPARVRYAVESWPAPPIIVPPVMVRDFNFSSLIDAV